MKENSVKKSTWIALAVFVVLIVAVDQLTKWLVVQYIPPHGDVAVIPNILHLTYVQNEGAAFSAFAGMRWLFIALFAVYAVVLFILIRKHVLDRPFELWCLAAISGGAIGNMIDRIFLGKVTDMISLKFFYIPMVSFKNGVHFSMVPFAIFNVADIFITCGVIAFAVYLLFFFREEKKEADEAAEESADEAAEETQDEADQ